MVAAVMGSDGVETVYGGACRAVASGEFWRRGGGGGEGGGGGIVVFRGVGRELGFVRWLLVRYFEGTSIGGAGLFLF